MTPAKSSGRSTKKSASAEVLSKLSTWTTLNNLSSDPYVRELKTSIESGQNLAAMSEFNPMDMLPMPTESKNARKRSLSNNLAIIRNVLVFLPVALTWIAINKSTTAFAAYTQANKADVVNFLEFWQNGYGVLSSTWRIGEVALADFFIIMVVIGLTLSVAFMNKKALAAQKAFSAKANLERTELALEITKFLVSHRTPTTASINLSITSALRALADASKELNKASKELNKDIKEIPSNKQVLAEIKKLNIK